MKNQKIYQAHITVVFNIEKKEDPKKIARYITKSIDGMRGANLYMDATLTELKKLT